MLVLVNSELIAPGTIASIKATSSNPNVTTSTQVTNPTSTRETLSQQGLTETIPTQLAQSIQSIQSPIAQSSISNLPNTSLSQNLILSSPAQPVLRVGAIK